MQATKQQAKPLAKKTQDSEAPYPSFITQVQKDDQNNQSIGSLTKLYSCCMYFWKCLTPKKPATFEKIDEGSVATLLEPQLPEHKGRKVLVLDLDETLVHSTFEPVQKADLVLPVHIQGMVYKINVIKRPGCEEFIARMGELYEVVVFTASLSEYAEPLCKILDPTNAISSILYRQHCTPLNGVYVKDMTLLGRNMEDIILVDNSPNSFLFQPENAYHIKNFFDDKTDRELYRLAQFLENIIHVPDVRPIEDLRRQYEPQINPKTMKFVKTNRNEVVDLNDSNGLLRANSRHQPAQNNRKEDRERTLNIETEPDLRRGDREEQFAQIPDQGGDDDYRPGGYVFKGGAVTERVGFDDNFELPSPKESDGLIFHSNTTSKGKKKTFVPPLAKDVDTFNKLTRGEGELVVEETHVIDGQKVDDVRLLSDMGNLNSPLGRQVKIEYNKENAV